MQQIIEETVKINTGPVPKPARWMCNGSINPLIRSVMQLKEICTDDADWREAVRCLDIQLSCYGQYPSVYTPELTETQLRDIAQRWLEWRATPFWKRSGKEEIAPGMRTTAQLLSKHGNLHCRAECCDIDDICRCFELAGSYNDFDSNLAIREFRRFNLGQYYSNDNPNTGSDAFHYHFGWEGSLVVYIDARFYLGLKTLSRDWKHWTECDPDTFAAMCRDLGKRTRADESDLSEDHKDSRTWRLWWD